MMLDLRNFRNFLPRLGPTKRHSVQISKNRSLFALIIVFFSSWAPQTLYQATDQTFYATKSMPASDVRRDAAKLARAPRHFEKFCNFFRKNNLGWVALPKLFRNDSDVIIMFKTNFYCCKVALLRLEWLKTETLLIIISVTGSYSHNKKKNWQLFYGY